MSSCAGTQSLLWEEFFRDPSLFWDKRKEKKSSESPDFSHKVTGKSLWTHVMSNPPWVKVELKELKLIDSSACNLVNDHQITHYQDRISLLNLIKSCGKEKNTSKVRKIHADMVQRKWISKDVYIATALLSTYAKCGAFNEAREIFDQLPVHSVVSWTSLISGYTQHGFGDKALDCFREMQDEGICPDAITYNCLLKACGMVGALEIGESIENEVRKQGLLEKNGILGTSLVDMYAKCGSLEKACKVLKTLPNPGSVSWNALMAGYSQHGLGEEILQCFKEMKEEGVTPDAVTYVFILKACGIVGCLDIGKDVDTEVRKQGLLQKDIVLGTALLDMYAKCGVLDKAREVFERLPVRDVVSWNALICGYDRHGLGEEALKCFRQMQDEGIRPNAVTYICILKACGIVGCLEIGKEIDAEFRKQRLLQNNILLGTTLVDMYTKCGSMEKAREVFEQLPMQNVVTWNALIAGYARHGLGHEALECFKLMQDKGVSPDAVTYACILKVCSIVQSLETGKDIDAKIRKRGLLRKDIVLSNALVEMYLKCGALEKAREVCEQLPDRNVASWTILMAGYVERGLGEEAMDFFRKMKNEGVFPDIVTYICILKACAIVGSLQTGKVIDAEVRKQGLLQKNFMLGNALIDMYAKCGALQKAQEVFEQLPVWGTVSWTALMAGYAQLGQANVVLNMFRKMRTENVMPDLVTFLVLLTACSHAGLVEEGEILFDLMRVIYSLTPTQEHYICMIDLFGRAGYFEKAKGLLDEVPSSDHLPLFLAILGSCQKWINVKLGRWAFEQSLQLSEKCVPAYIYMENIYVASGIWMEADASDSRY